jgi:hypothetical protein
MDLHAQQRQGYAAEDLLANPLLAEALKAIKDEVTAQWMECPARDHEGKEALWQLAKTAQKFENLLTGYIQTGKLATDKLKQYEDRKGLMDRIRRIA